jgi:hypothetical protein
MASLQQMISGKFYFGPCEDTTALAAEELQTDIIISDQKRRLSE